MFPPVMLALTDTTDPNMLEPVTVPVELTSPPVKMFLPVMLAALVIVLVADINPPVNTLPPVMFALADTTDPK
jgi:hypothetical protein